MSGKILITSRSFGSVSNKPIELLKKNGFELYFKDKSGLYQEEDFLKVINDYVAIIIGADKLTARPLKKAENLIIVCKHGTGVDNIDLEAAKSNKIRVTNVPTANSDAVADFAFGLIIDVARKISLVSGKVKSGEWNKVIGSDVYNKTLGIIGFGAIGKKVAKRAEGFSMRVLIYDPFVEKISRKFASQLKSFVDVLKEADFLTVHVPLNNDTINLIDETQIQLMKKGSFIINTSRGGIVNEDALYRNLKNGHLAGVGLDVTEKEPPNNSSLLKLDNVTLTSHVASYSKEALNTVSLVCANNIVKEFNGMHSDNIVT